MLFPIIDAALATINKTIDKIFPDATVAEQVKATLAVQALEWYKLEAGDRDSARRREVDAKDNTTKQLAWLYTTGYFGMLAALLGGWVHVALGMESLLDVLIGVLTAGQYSILQYYFGSSSGSANKDRIREKLQDDINK